jgi:hypothetical protein
MEQRQDEQAPVGAAHLERAAPHAGHGIEVGVVEHDALGYASRAAGVDQQRERSGIGANRHIRSIRDFPEVADG